ncbi:MAG: hypothetical protein GXY83_05710 [Rhodopirellula sp.]|nr:hypothetical protein [Rhodopirellula sp.]
MQSTLLGYIGPETLVPAASALAAIIGGLLAFGRTGWSWSLRAVRFCLGRHGAADLEDAESQVPEGEVAPARRAA